MTRSGSSFGPLGRQLMLLGLASITAGSAARGQWAPRAKHGGKAVESACLASGGQKRPSSKFSAHWACCRAGESPRWLRPCPTKGSPAWDRGGSWVHQPAQAALLSSPVPTQTQGQGQGEYKYGSVVLLKISRVVELGSDSKIIS